MNKLCFHHLSIAVEDLERARQFYTDVLELQELHRPPNFGHLGIWYKIGDGQPQLHILVRSEATLRRDKWIDLADIHFALRVESYRDTLTCLGSKGFRDDLPDDDFRKMQLRPNSPAGYPQIYILAAGEIKATQSVSLADAFVAATAQLTSAVLIHKDPEFEPLKGTISLQALPYKPSTKRASR